MEGVGGGAGIQTRESITENNGNAGEHAIGVQLHPANIICHIVLCLCVYRTFRNTSILSYHPTPRYRPKLLCVYVSAELLTNTSILSNHRRYISRTFSSTSIQPDIALTFCVCLCGPRTFTNTRISQGSFLLIRVHGMSQFTRAGQISKVSLRLRFYQRSSQVCFSYYWNYFEDPPVSMDLFRGSDRSALAAGRWQH